MIHTALFLGAVDAAAPMSDRASNKRSTKYLQTKRARSCARTAPHLDFPI